MKINKKKTILFSIVFIFILMGAFIYHNYIAKAATYGWVQTVWSTLSSNTAEHVSDQTGWEEYSAKDSNVSTGDSVSITSEITTLTHTTTSDFSSGTGTGTITTGDEVGLDLP